MGHHPTLGKQIFYVLSSRKVRAAIITAVHSEDLVDLTVFYNRSADVGPDVQRLEYVRYDPNLKPGTWHF